MRDDDDDDEGRGIGVIVEPFGEIEASRGTVEWRDGLVEVLGEGEVISVSRKNTPSTSPSPPL